MDRGIGGPPLYCSVAIRLNRSLTAATLWLFDREARIRTDLTAKRWAEFDSGEIETTIQIYASKHAFKQDKPWRVLDMRIGGLTVTKAHTVAFDEAWTVSEHKRGGMAPHVER